MNFKNTAGNLKNRPGGSGVWGKRGSHWHTRFGFITEPSKRKAANIEDAGGEFERGTCFNCGFRLALKMPGDEYPKCWRCEARWGADVDNRRDERK